ncbi:MAG: glycosyltransferase family 4 protein [Rubrobacteraceae bacterium]
MPAGGFSLVSGGLAFLIAGSLVPLLVRFAVGRNLMDVPNTRSSHETPTPRLGGVAVVAGTWFGVLFSGLEDSWPLLLAATTVGLVGLADDFLDLHFGAKASAQILAAGVLLYLHPPQILSEAPVVFAPFVFLVGVFWISAVCNAYNFMDGIDGITGGVALAGGLFLFVLVGDVGAFLPAFVGAVAGFLVWNINPASIFMGDAGSYFVGFALAAVALYAPAESGWSPLPFFACVLVFTPYLFDTAFTIFRRLRFGAGKNIFSAHREHVYQRITPEVSMHRRTSNLYYGLSVVAGFAALLASNGGVFLFLGILLAALCCGFMVVLPDLVRDREGG